MKPVYQNITSPDYVLGLNYAYWELYSLQRGAAYEAKLSAEKKAFDVLKVRRNKGHHLSPDEQTRYTNLNELLGYTQYLINNAGSFHPSSSLTNRFDANASQSHQLLHILKTPAINIPAWMCAPVYRDAIVFYNNTNTIVSTLNVCFSCERMATGAFNEIDADALTYKLLKDFFTDCGHQITEN